MLLDLVVLAALALAALHGAVSGALRQGVQLLGALAGWIAARALAPAVAAGLARSLPRWFPDRVAHLTASALLFFGGFALVTLVGAMALRATSMARVVGGPTDRGVGGLLGGVKGVLMAWVLLSALALAGGAQPGWARESQFAETARAHNLLRRIDPERVRLLERLVAAVAEARRPGAAKDEAVRGLLAHPRVKALADAGGGVDRAEAERLLDDPQVRELVEKMRERAGNR